MEEYDLTINGKDERAFLDANNHKDIKTVTDIGLTWPNLVDLHDYYRNRVVGDLELKVQQLQLEFQNFNGAYIVRSRVKDPEHLIDKVIRKATIGKIITKDNFLDKVDDLIGLRVLHLFKGGWEPIYQELRKRYEPNEEPVAYYREGDDERYLNRCAELGIKPEPRPAGYRSIHYIAKIPFFGYTFKCEVQIRTIFEDAWGEIDHLVRYPNLTDNELVNKYLLMFNRLAGCADDMGTFLLAMKSQQEEQKEQAKKLIDEISELEGDNATKNAKINELRKRLERSKMIGWPYMPENPMQSTLDYISKIQNPSGSIYPAALTCIQENMENTMKQLNKETFQKAFAGPQPFVMPKIGSVMPPKIEDLPWWNQRKDDKDKPVKE